jgi:tetratricopeptide (TPR) repeat protein
MRNSRGILRALILAVPLAEPLHADSSDLDAKLRHATAAEAATRDLPIDDPRRPRALERLAVVMHEQGRYAAAEGIWRRAVAAWERAAGGETLAAAAALEGLAETCLVLGHMEEAESVLARVVVLKTRHFGPDHPVFASTYQALASVHAAEGRRAEAEGLYRWSLDIRGWDVLPAATTLVGLGHVLLAEGRYTESAAHLERARVLFERLAPAGHVGVPMALHSLGRVRQEQGRGPEAEGLFQRALALLEALFGDEHPLELGPLGELAAIYEDQGRLGDAIALRRRASAAAERAYGPDHPALARTLVKLGEALRRRELFEQAQEALDRALVLAERHRSADPRARHVALDGQARLAFSRGNLPRAISLYRDLTAITRADLGRDHPDHTIAATNLAYLRRASERTRPLPPPAFSAEHGILDAPWGEER